MYLSSTDRVIRAKRGTSGIHVMKTVQAVIICQYEVQTVYDLGTIPPVMVGLRKLAALLKRRRYNQCCGSGSGIRDWGLFDPWIRDPE